MQNTYSIEEIHDKGRWEAFMLSRPEANFRQSWNWGSFQENLGKRTLPLGLIKGEDLVGGAMLIKEEAKRGWYLTIDGGPVINWEDKQQVFLFLSKLKKVVLKEQCLFIRMRPQLYDTKENRNMLKDQSLRKSSMHLTADLTIQLDLSLSEDDLLKHMRKNTRYEVRKAQREGVEIETSKDPAEIRSFYEHQVTLAKRHNFVPFGYDFLHEQFKTFVADDQVMLFHSKYKGQLLASAFIIFYNQEAVYHYGISTPINAKLPGSYACQWAAIKEAKRRHCSRYNFWGVAPKGAKGHRFSGVSTFKRGFGGKEIKYIQAHDLVVNNRYWATWGFEMVRRKIRKL